MAKVTYSDMNGIQRVSSDIESFKSKFWKYCPKHNQIVIVFPHHLIDAAKRQNFAKKHGKLQEPSLKVESYPVGKQMPDQRPQKQPNKGSSLMSSHADNAMNMMVASSKQTHMLQLQQQSNYPKHGMHYEEETNMNGREMGQYSMFPRARASQSQPFYPTHPGTSYSDPAHQIKAFMHSRASDSQKQQFMYNYLTPRVAGLIAP